MMSDGQVIVTLNDRDQIEAFQDAEGLIQDDYQDGLVDGREWGGELPTGEVVRILAEAYVGTLEVDEDAVTIQVEA